MNLEYIVETLPKYKICIEYQGADGTIYNEEKEIYLSVPFKPETMIHELWHARNPDMGSTQVGHDELERQSQQYLKKNPSVKAYLKGYLDTTFRQIFEKNK